MKVSTDLGWKLVASGLVAVALSAGTVATAQQAPAPGTKMIQRQITDPAELEALLAQCMGGKAPAKVAKGTSAAPAAPVEGAPKGEAPPKRIIRCHFGEPSAH